MSHLEVQQVLVVLEVHQTAAVVHQSSVVALPVALVAHYSEDRYASLNCCCHAAAFLLGLLLLYSLDP